MRVVLVNPPSLPGTTANREGTAGMGVLVPRAGAFFYPPQTIAYSVAVLQAMGYQVMAVDAVGEGLDVAAVVTRCRDARPDVIAVQVAPQTWTADRVFLEALRECLPQVPRLLFGTGAVFVQGWQSWADALLVGDAEWGLGQAIAALMSGETVRGLWWAGQSQPPPPVRIPAGASLPRPAWDSLPVERYPFLTLWGSRGCEANCRWCPYVLGWGHTRRARDPETVADELWWLGQTFRKSRHIFRDPVFAADEGWVFDFCAALRQRGRPPAWECEDRPEHLSPELVAAMASAGCTQIKLGLEVLSGPLLHRWGRLPAPEALTEYQVQAAAVIRACRRHNVMCHVFIVIGLGETEADLAATAEFLAAAPPHHVSVKRFIPYPGLRPPEHIPLPEATLNVWAQELARRSIPARPGARARVRRWFRWLTRG